MTEVWFYHLERATLAQVMPDLLQKTLTRGWRAAVRLADEPAREQLDQWLWAFRDDAFLAHGLASEPHAERQPILLSADGDRRNGAQVLFILDGSDEVPTEGLERCIRVFDGRDELALAAARRHWKQAAAEGLSVSYWKQDEQGRWQKAG